MQNEKVPEWAVERAKDETDKYAGIPLGYDRIDSCDIPSVYAFARYIAEHEDPPVDPLRAVVREAVIEARPEMLETADFESGNAEVIAGAEDFTTRLTAELRSRGIELARKEDSHAG